MNNEIYVFGHQSPDTDSVCSAIAYANLKKQLGFNAVPYRLSNNNKETLFALEYFNVEEPDLLTEIKNSDKKQDVILVDHNERGQSVLGIENANILEVIDHHRISDFQTESPIFMRFEPVGCSSTIIFKMYQEKNIDIPKSIAGVMLSAILSDTLIFTSPTCTEEDIAAGKKLAEIAGVDFNTYGNEMFKAGTSLDGYSPEEILALDRKKFSFGDYTSYISQVNTMDNESIEKLKPSLLSAMKKFLEENECDFAVLMLTNIINGSSELLAVGDIAESILYKAFDKKLENNSMYLEGVVSRKKQIVPMFTSAVRK